MPFGSDEDFDDLLPAHLKIKSSVHFTPVEVAVVAARLLAPKPGMRILDVGCGPGKFCLTAANQCPTSIFEGVDFRKRVVEIATGLAQQLGLQNASFIHADAFALDWSKYDGFYFFNPFAEQLYHGFLFLDHTIEFDPAKYVQFVLAVRARLADARIGTRVVTYHGFGGSTPSGYELVSDQVVGTDRIELWEKVRPTYRIMIDDAFAEAV